MDSWPQMRRLGLLLRRNWKLWWLATFVYRRPGQTKPWCFLQKHVEKRPLNSQSLPVLANRPGSHVVKNPGNRWLMF